MILGGNQWLPSNFTAFMNRIQDMAAIVPYMTCVGNHGKLNQTNIACCIILFFSLWTPASLQFPSRLVPAIESCQASTRHTEEGMLAAYYLRHCLIQHP